MDLSSVGIVTAPQAAFAGMGTFSLVWLKRRGLIVPGIYREGQRP